MSRITQGRYDFMSGLHPAYMETLLDEAGTLRPSFESTLKHLHIPFLKTDYPGWAGWSGHPGGPA